MLRGAQAELRRTRQAAVENDTATGRETDALAAEVRRLHGAADAENARLRLMLREAETRADKLAASLDEARGLAANIERKVVLAIVADLLQQFDYFSHHVEHVRLSRTHLAPLSSF